MIYKRCQACNGSGKMMGGGMIMQDCEHCRGKGKIETVENEIAYLEAKKTEAFKESVKEIQALNPVISEGAAEKLLSRNFDKAIDKRRPGRPRKYETTEEKAH